MDARVPAVGLVVVAVVIGLVVVPSSVPRAVGASAETGQPATATCDYAALYDRTIESVTLVRRETTQGSGFVYERMSDNDTGYVVTNQHVVGDAREVYVTFQRGDTREGSVVGTDVFADLAVVRVDDTPDYATPLPVAEESPEPGRKVAALGSPLGLPATITHGIVSGVNRSMPTDRGFAVPDTIQTDAPINPGSSGGPLLTCDGTVVGVNTAGIQAGLAENVGFAVSATLVQRVVPALIDDGDVDWAYLGVVTTPVTPATAAANDLETTRGVMVVETVDGGPSEGVLRASTGTATVDGETVPVGGDVIVAIDGQAVASSEDLATYLATEAAPGQQVDLTVVRDGERRTVTVTLGERPEPAA